MTSKLTITDERVISVIERLEHYACNLKWTNVRGAQDLLTAADGLRELQERRKAAMDSEPVAWMHNNNDLGVPAITTNPKIGHYWTAEFKGVEPLYRHAQPAPVVTFYRDGIEAAAKWIDQQREAYDSEHGWSDPDTGAFEFGNDAQREYSSTLEELAEGIRALHPNAGNSPVIPDGYVMVPNNLLSELRDWAHPEIEKYCEMWEGRRDSEFPALRKVIADADALLAAAPQPQNAPQNIPEIIPGWIPVSERLPDKNQSVLISVNFDSSLVDPLICTARYTGSTFRRGEATVKPGSGIEEVTHWMPLPAAPQNDINALIPLVSRNEQEVK